MKEEEIRKLKEDALKGLGITQDGKGADSGKDEGNTDNTGDKGNTSEEETSNANPDENNTAPDGDESNNSQIEKSESQQQSDDYKSLYEKEKQRYSVLQGKYNKEVPALNSQIRELKDKVTQLTEQVKHYEKISSQQSDRNNEPDKDKTELEERMMELLGDDPEMMKTFKAFIKENTRTENSEMKEVKDKLNRFEQSQEQKELEQFKAAVLSSVPDFNAIIQDPLFDEFTKQVDPVTGYTYGQWLHHHDQNRNVQGLVHILNTYKGSEYYNGSGGKAQSQTTKQKRKAPVSPQTSGANSTGIDTKDKRTYSIKEFNDLNIKNIKDFNNGRITKEKYDTVSMELKAAVKEGRIVD